jgi:hypothetical protein
MMVRGNFSPRTFTQIPATGFSSALVAAKRQPVGRPFHSVVVPEESTAQRPPANRRRTPQALNEQEHDIII